MTADNEDGWGKPAPSQTAQSSEELSPPNSPADSYEVGYGKPPKHSRWKPGQSGNTKGPKKKPGSVRERVQALLERKLTTSGGQQITVTDAILNTAITGLTSKGGRSVKQSIEMIEFLERFDTKIGFTPTAADESRLSALLAGLKSKGDI